MKNSKKIIAAILSVTLLGTAAAPVYAKPVPDKKQEVLYVMTDASGKVNDIEAVNIFPGGEITDYGDYTAVKVLNTTDDIKQEGDKISISSSADKVYYQGTMKAQKLPWDISIRYFLDGKEYSPSEIAGKSGALKIQFSITENKECTGSFYKDYALQASFTLDTEKCTDIVADGATLANVGSDKQISYTILPGRGIDAVIEATVTDFEMAAVSINGIQLNLDVDIDDEELKSKVNDLVDAVSQLDDGAVKLKDGSEELRNGSSDLKDGTSALHSGSVALDEGILSLQSGLTTLQKGLNSLDKQSPALVKGSADFKAALKTLQTAVSSISTAEKDLSELVKASGQIKQAIHDLSAGASALQKNLGYAQYKALMAKNGLDIDKLTKGNADAVATITEYEALIEKLSQVPEYQDIMKKYKPELLQTTKQLTGLLNANNAAFGGMESYLNGISNELPALTDGLSKLNTQYETFDTAISGLVTALGSMTGNLSPLADGINQLVASYEKLDTGVNGYTKGVAQIVAGYSQLMNGVTSLAGGSKELVSGSGELYDGTAKLYDGVSELYNGTKDMAEGTGEFRKETSDMNKKMDEEIDSILDTIGGSTGNPVSFVSSKNTDIDSVQFVIKTTAIEIPETEVAETVEPEPLNFWQKLLKLFGI